MARSRGVRHGSMKSPLHLDQHLERLLLVNAVRLSNVFCMNLLISIMPDRGLECVIEMLGFSGEFS